MKIAVFSDSHGCVQNMADAVIRVRPDMIVHLGDCTRDARALAEEFPDIPMHSVKGNCDVDYATPEDEVFEAGGVRFFIAHGHRQNVKIQTVSLLNAVYFSGARIGLYGHTHAARIKEIEDVTIMNPGSCRTSRRPTFGVITVNNGEFECAIREITADYRLHFPTTEEDE